MPLFNIFNNKLNNLVKNFDKKDIIYYKQTKNTTGFQQANTRRNRIAGYFEIEKKIEDVNKNIFEINFFY